MSESNGYGEFEEVEATPEQRTKAELRQLIESGNLDAALTKAKEMQAKERTEQKTESKSRALELVEQSPPGEPLDLLGLIGALEIGAASAEYEGLFKPVSEITPVLPKPILGAKGVGGAVLTAGNVCILSGQGGVAKTTLTASIALSFAACTEMESREMVALQGGIFNGTGGRVMIASFEDSANTISYRLQGLASIWQKQDRGIWFEAARQTKILCAELPEPLFIGVGFELPEPTRAWGCLWETAKEFQPKLIVVDPIIGAYVGNGNDPATVFAFCESIGTRS